MDVAADEGTKGDGGVGVAAGDVRITGESGGDADGGGECERMSDGGGDEGGGGIAVAGDGDAGAGAGEDEDERGDELRQSDLQCFLVRNNVSLGPAPRIDFNDAVLHCPFDQDRTVMASPFESTTGSDNLFLVSTGADNLIWFYWVN